MSINDKFGSNRAKFRRVYAYNMSRRPDVRSFVDAITNTTKSFDFQNIERDRDCYIVNGLEIHSPPNIVQYIEYYLNLSSSIDHFDFTFPSNFDQIPFVAIELVEVSTIDKANVGYWVTDITSNGFTANFSAPFSGSVLYRAVYTDSSYPVYVERAPRLVGNFGWVSATTSSLNYQSRVTSSFATLPAMPDSILSNPVGLNTDPTLDIGQAYSSVGVDFVVNELSLPFSGTLQLVALSSVPPGTPQPIDPP